MLSGVGLGEHLSQSLLERLRGCISLFTTLNLMLWLDFLDRFADSFNHSDMALFVHHLDLSFEPVMKFDGLLSFSCLIL